jgi:hypothetical protein
LPSPFPGMDPYLERHDLWPSVHARLIGAIDEALGPQLPATYYTSIEERFELPGVEPIRQRYLEVRATGTHKVVTVIELLSPSNKLPGEGRRQYEAKRQETIKSHANLVEIDLLRAGAPLPVRYNGQALFDLLAGDYRVLTSRAIERPRAELLVFRLTDRLPIILVPQPASDARPLVDLQDALRLVYTRGAYERRIDYRTVPEPPLAPAIDRWADGLLREKGLR